MIALAACTTRDQAYPGVPHEVVWSAMKAAAESPTYDDWVLIENEVYVDEDARRIEVYRELRRDRVGPGTPHWRDEETWKLRMTLVSDDKTGDPEVVFTSRTWAVPAHAWREADRFFADVRELAGPPDPFATPAAAQGAPRSGDDRSTPPAAPTTSAPSATGSASQASPPASPASAPSSPPADPPASPPPSRPATPPPVDLPE